MSPLVKVNRLKMSHFGNRVYLGNTSTVIIIYD